MKKPEYRNNYRQKKKQIADGKEKKKTTL